MIHTAESLLKGQINEAASIYSPTNNILDRYKFLIDGGTALITAKEIISLFDIFPVIVSGCENRRVLERFECSIIKHVRMRQGLSAYLSNTTHNNNNKCRIAPDESEIKLQF